VAVTTVATLAQPLVLPATAVSAVALALVARPTFIAGVYVAIDAALTDPIVAKVLPSPAGTVLVAITDFGSATPGATIPAGAAVCVTGPPGPQGNPGGIGSSGLPGLTGLGPPGPSGSGATQTVSTAVLPSTTATVTVTVANGSAFPNGQDVIVSDGTNAFYGVVQSGGGTSTLVILCQGVLLGTPGATIAANAIVSFYATGGNALPGVACATIAAGVGTNTTIKSTPGTLVGVLVTTPGSNPMQFVDGTTGKIIGKLGPNAPYGFYPMGLTATQSIIAVGNAANPAVTVEYA
jgi:hypothetical protein